MDSTDGVAKAMVRGTLAAMLAIAFFGLNALPIPVAESAGTPIMQREDVPLNTFSAPRSFARKERFSTAPWEWRVAGAGIAEVKNRWQCDPRWTFLGLRNDQKMGKPAVLWSKRLFPGDVSVEFYFGIQMDHLRGMYCTYARDVNVTIGSDGSDLRKGCTFSYGGHNNTCSYIMRDGIELKRGPVTIPTHMDYFLHWFQFRAERREGKLRFKVERFFRSDDEKEAEWIVADARPFDGNRVAIWTYDNAIMIGKVWISGEGGEMESPDFFPGAVKTIYDE